MPSAAAAPTQTKWTLPLRSHQTAAAEAFLSFLKSGGKRGIVALPTGTGKTVLGLYIASLLGRCIWISHRLELVDQPADKLRDCWPDCSYGIVRAAQDGFAARDFISCSIQTIQNPERLGRILKNGSPIKLIVIDEVHHAVKGSAYARVLDELPDVPVLGLSATLERSDGQALDLVESVVFSLQMQEAILDGALSPPVLPFELDELPTLKLTPEELAQAKGDESSAEEIIKARVTEHVQEISQITAEKIRDNLQDRRSILAFTVLVRQAELTAQALRDLGISAEFVSGEMAKGKRAQILEDFRAGKIRVVANAMTLTEGTDIPCVDGIVCARPFVSRSSFVQAIGRATRLSPTTGKENWRVLDLSGCTRLHDPFHQAPLLVGEEKGEGDGLGGGGGGLSLPFSGEIKEPPPPIRWLRMGVWAYAASAGSGKQILIKLLPAENRWSVAINKPRKETELVGAFRDLDLAMGVGADAVRRLGGLRYGGARESTFWRQRAVSEAQQSVLRRFGLDPRAYKSAGEASDAITVVQARRRLRPERGERMM